MKRDGTEGETPESGKGRAWILATSGEGGARESVCSGGLIVAIGPRECRAEATTARTLLRRNLRA